MSQAVYGSVRKTVHCKIPRKRVDFLRIEPTGVLGARLHGSPAGMLRRQRVQAQNECSQEYLAPGKELGLNNRVWVLSDFSNETHGCPKAE